MKTFTISILLLLAFSFVNGQSSLHYNFTNSLQEANVHGPTLTTLGTPGTFVLDTLNEISGKTKTVYRFDQNCGFQFDNLAAGTFIDSTYTIELYFVFDNLTSWKRVVDWKNRKTDYGAYVYYGELNFYNYVYSGTAPVLPGEYTYYVITRKASDKTLKIYTDALVEISFTDTYGDAIIDSDHFLNFFYDDLVVPNEASSGAVAILNLYNYALDSTAIKHNFDNIQGQVFAVNEKGRETSRLIAPNPAHDMVTVNLTEFPQGTSVNVMILNASGSVVCNKNLAAGIRQKMDIRSLGLAPGIYLVKAESNGLVFTQKLFIQ